MKRVLKITAKTNGTTAEVRIEIHCDKKARGNRYYSVRAISQSILNDIANGAMEAIRDADFFRVPLSQQRVGR